jgi:hypothetical protein
MIIVITPAEFKARFPEFSGVDNALIQAIIDESVEFLFGYRRSASFVKLQLFLTAHNLFIQQEASKGDGSSSNPITSKTVGNVSASYAATATSAGGDMASYWNSTSYGQQFYIYWTQARYIQGPYGVI